MNNSLLEELKNISLQLNMLYCKIAEHEKQQNKPKTKTFTISIPDYTENEINLNEPPEILLINELDERNIQNSNLDNCILNKNEEDNVSFGFKDGTFFIRKNGLIEYKFFYNGIRKNVYGKTKNECYNKRLDFIISNADKTQEHKKATNKTITYSEWLNKWYQIYKVPYNGEKSLFDIKKYIDKYISPHLGAYPIDKLKKSQTQEFINRYSTKPNTQKKISDILYASLECAKEDDLIEKNPYIKKRLSPKSQNHYRALEFDEQLAIYNECSEEYKTLFFFACCTGIRIGKLLELTADNFDKLKREIIVLKKQHRGKNEIYTVPYLNELIDIPKEGKLFANINYNSTRLYFRRLYKKLGIKKANLHSFRHTFVSVLYHVGTKEKQIQAWAGHNTLAITTDIYTHLLYSEKKSPIKDYLQKLKNERSA